MPVIVVANPKGGVGKSTLSTNLAGYFASRGHAVMLGDVDRQQSALTWLSLRPPQCPRRPCPRRPPSRPRPRIRNRRNNPHEPALPGDDARVQSLPAKRSRVQRRGGFDAKT